MEDLIGIHPFSNKTEGRLRGNCEGKISYYSLEIKGESNKSYQPRVNRYFILYTGTEN